MKNLFKNEKGQVALIPVIVTGISAIIASAISGWTASNIRTSGIDTKVQVVERTEEIHYKELSKKMDYIIDKLDKMK